MATEQKVPSRASQYLAYVSRILERDRGAGAALKRSLSGIGEHRRAVYPFLLPLLEGITPRDQDIWFLVAGLYALYPQPLEREKSLSFGRSCQILHARINSGGPERRFKSLLETDFADLDVPLAALVRLMKAHDVPIDYVSLLSHLQHWDQPSQWVQDRWARDFWAWQPSNLPSVTPTLDQ